MRGTRLDSCAGVAVCGCALTRRGSRRGVSSRRHKLRGVCGRSRQLFRGAADRSRCRGRGRLAAISWCSAASRRCGRLRLRLLRPRRRAGRPWRLQLLQVLLRRARRLRLLASALRGDAGEHRALRLVPRPVPGAALPLLLLPGALAEALSRLRRHLQQPLLRHLSQPSRSAHVTQPAIRHVQH